MDFSAVLCRILRLSGESLALPPGRANAFWRLCARPGTAPCGGLPDSVRSGPVFPRALRTRRTGRILKPSRWQRGCLSALLDRVGRSSPNIRPETTYTRGDDMFKITRAAVLAAALLVAATSAVAPQAAQAQAQPPAATSPAPSAEPPATAPKAASSARATEIVDNPYGLEALWKGGDIVAKVTLAILALMSVGSWYIIVTKIYEQARMGRQARAADKKFWTAPSVRQGADVLKKGSPYRFIAESGLEASTTHVGLLGNVDLNTWITMSIQRAIDNVHSRTQDGLAFLAIVGSTAPFVGLFGTVWGIYHALTAIGIAGQASIDKVAGPVGEALIMTAFGLAVAVPAVLGYNWLVRRNKVALEHLRGFGQDLHMVLMSGGANVKRGPTPAAAAAAR